MSTQSLRSDPHCCGLSIASQTPGFKQWSLSAVSASSSCPSQPVRDCSPLVCVASQCSLAECRNPLAICQYSLSRVDWQVSRSNSLLLKFGNSLQVDRNVGDSRFVNVNKTLSSKSDTASDEEHLYTCMEHALFWPVLYSTS